MCFINEFSFSFLGGDTAIEWTGLSGSKSNVKTSS